PGAAGRGQLHQRLLVAGAQSLVAIQDRLVRGIQLEDHAKYLVRRILGPFGIALAGAVRTALVKTEPMTGQSCRGDKPCRSNPCPQTSTRHVGTKGEIQHDYTD